MEIHVKVVGTLKKYVTDTQKSEGLTMTVEEDCTLREVIRKLKLPEKEVFTCAVNGKLSKTERSIKDGDRVIFYSLIAGG
jgi:sulfur carrier protein ThiS